MNFAFAVGCSSMKPGFYRDKGKEHGNYCIVYCGYIAIMEKKKLLCSILGLYTKTCFRPPCSSKRQHERDSSYKQEISAVVKLETSMMASPRC